MDDRTDKTLSNDAERTYSETQDDVTPLQTASSTPSENPQPISDAASGNNMVESSAAPVAATPVTPVDAPTSETPVAPGEQSSTLNHTPGTYAAPASAIGSGPAFTPTDPSSSNKKKWLVIGGSVAAVLAVVIAAVLVYFLWYQKPEKVLGDAIGNIVTAKDMTFTGSVEAKSTGGLNASYDGTVTDSKLALNMTLKMSGEQKLTVPFNVVSDSKTLFFKVTELKELEQQFLTPMMGMYGLSAAQQSSVDKLVADIDGQWYKVTPDDIDKNRSDAEKKSSQCVVDQIEKIRSDKATQNELSKIYKDNQLFTIAKSLGVKDGSAGYEVKAVSNKQAKPFFEALSKSKFFKDLQKCDKEIKIDLSKYDEKDSEKDTSTIQVWVSQWSHQFTKISVESNHGKEDNVTMLFEPKISEKKAVDMPKDAKSIDDLTKQFQDLSSQLYSSDPYAGYSTESSSSTMLGA